jgi:hypothetical protein
MDTSRRLERAATDPIYNRGKDIQRFLASAVEGAPVIPVSKIDFESALIDLKVPKR